ncbi:uncharacterized protein LOC116296017 [Actinia tenebrosa]|uniref:Uncharacterized protein LOC116296017 n=1 Tax=Actinia tenebrosa TaxID=6105 RepID=A0A6P8I4Z7_ACTTE|nr:uncharacterized protein LOC116296017 [Actinia tenebrosa]
MESSSNTSLKLNSSLPSFPLPDEECLDKTFMLCITVFVLITSLAGNSLVIRFVFRNLKQRKSPDKIFLLQISFSNLLACCVSLPLHYFDVVFIGRIPLSLNVANSLCFIKLFLLFFCLQVGHVTLSVLCYDRYEAITKFPQQRLLTYGIAKQASCGIIVCIFVIYFSSMISYVIDFHSGNTICEGLQIRSMGQQGNAAHVSNIALIVVTVILISTANTICFWNLFLVDRKLRHHKDSVRSTLGDQSMVKEVRLVYSAVSFVITYSIVWIPFGVFRSLRNIFPSSTSIRCYYITAFTCSYMVFSLIPLLYIITDKRIQNPISKFSRKNRVAPDENSTRDTKGPKLTDEKGT